MNWQDGPERFEGGMSVHLMGTHERHEANRFFELTRDGRLNINRFNSTDAPIQLPEDVAQALWERLMLPNSADADPATS